MRHRIVIEIESHVGSLADADFDSLVCRERVWRKRQQFRLLFDEDVAYGATLVLWPRSCCSDIGSPLCRLLIQVLERSPLTGFKEGAAHVAYESFHAALLVSARDSHGARLEAIMTSELQELWVKAHSVALPLKHSAFQVIVQATD